MTDMQKFAYAQMIDTQQQIVYVSGNAGSGKTTVALLAFHSKELKGRCQAAAGTAKAASNFNGPTIHGMLCWGIDDTQGVAPKKIDHMRSFYEKTDVFIIDEVNAISASTLALLDQRMNDIFEPQKNQSRNKWTRFGGKRMIFLGDPAQLRPVLGAAIYDRTERSAAPVDLEQSTSPIVSKQKGYKAAKHQYQSNLTAKGKVLYQQYLLPNSIIFKREKRCGGLLQEICDKLRDGTQDKHDLAKLMYLKRRFPGAECDNGIHYENDQCFLHNWRELWDDCQTDTPNKHLYVCKATYETMPNNQSVIDGLSSLPPKVFSYAPDVLCIAEGCDIRLVKNINIAAGLVNGASGTVVKVIYNNADLWSTDHQGILDGKFPPPYCIVVDLDRFQGFIIDKNQPNEKLFPFPDHKTWVPIYREKFVPTASELPQWIRKRQTAGLCYRLQFPMDLSKHLTAHRAQGQTLANALVSVDLQLDNLDNFVPHDIGSITYVALTRVKRLKIYLFHRFLWKFGKRLAKRMQISDAETLKDF